MIQSAARSAIDLTGTGHERRWILYVIGLAVLLVAVGPLAFWLGGNLVGFIFIAAWVALIAFIARRSDWQRSQEALAPRGSTAGIGPERTTASSESGRGGGRLLIAAGAVASSPREIPLEAKELIESAAEIRVIAPTLPTRFQWLASATDKAHEQADERLRTVLGHLDELGADPQGAVGADDPLLAFEDAIRDFSPDHLLIALRGGAQADWQERGLLDGLKQRFGIPITVFELSDDQATAR
jgi:hypothetical protein